jgi:hypothetical protein
MAATGKHAKTSQSHSQPSKLRVHIVCISVGGIIAIAASFISVGIAYHVAPFIPVVPSMVQELLDKIFGW